MSTSETISVVSGLVSLVVSFLAIWLSVTFYRQTKDSETKVQLALESIKTQTDTLQAFNAKTLDRLTKFVTTPRDEPGQSTQILAATLRDLPDIVLKLRVPSDTSNEAALRQEIADAYIALWNYTGTANIWSSYCLPALSEFSTADNYHKTVKHIVDRSAADFRHITSLINQLNDADIRSSRNIHLYNEAYDQLYNFVADATEIFARRAQRED